jgi:hypothetical protein
VIGVYPGSFNPPTVAHLGIATAARDRYGLTRLDLVLSVQALEKEHVDRPLLRDRLAVLGALARRVGWLGVRTTEAQLLADIAEGYDVLVMGADKWHQVLDVRYYGGSSAARDAAVARLPRLAIAPRPPLDVPASNALDVDATFAAMSSTRARRGDRGLMVPEAAAFDRETGAWTDPGRYERWLAGPGRAEPT